MNILIKKLTIFLSIIIIGILPIQYKELACYIILFLFFIYYSMLRTILILNQENNDHVFI